MSVISHFKHFHIIKTGLLKLCLQSQLLFLVCSTDKHVSLVRVQQLLLLSELPELRLSKRDSMGVEPATSCHVRQNPILVEGKSLRDGPIIEFAAIELFH